MLFLGARRLVGYQQKLRSGLHHVGEMVGDLVDESRDVLIGNFELATSSEFVDPSVNVRSNNEGVPIFPAGSFEQLYRRIQSSQRVTPLLRLCNKLPGDGQFIELACVGQMRRAAANLELTNPINLGPPHA